jgi:uncharacterized protein YjbI with pentapeptide repeats
MSAPEPIPDLLKAVNEASGKAFALWITFLTVGTYLVISIGTTTHLQLLLAGPVKLPLLGVDLPLFAFYGFAPPLFLVLHLYVLMQLYLLARLLRLFDDDLRAADMIERDRRRIRGQLDKFVFTQFLIGAPQDVIVRGFLRAVVWLSFVVGPVLLLLGFQLRFLPYHNISITYVHRVTLLLDLVMLLLLWPKISRSSERQAKPVRNWKAFCRVGVAILVSALLGGFSAFVATVPGERADQSQLRDWEWRLFSQNLSLARQRLVEPDEDKLKPLAVTMPLSGRDLRKADFVDSDLRKSDLSDADLTGAYLIDANLTGAHLSRGHLNGADLIRANLTGADLSGANLTGADLLRTQLNGADLTVANLGSANLGDATLIGANLGRAYLGRAHLGGANLSGANLSGANLTSADLSGANLRGADLRGAELSGATLFRAVRRRPKGCQLPHPGAVGPSLRQAEGAPRGPAPGQAVSATTGCTIRVGSQELRRAIAALIEPLPEYNQ